jgi:two-component system LytT family response regulator
MGMKIRTIIVDDEPNSREMLEHLLLATNNDIEVIDKCENVDTAFSAIKEHKPDIIFLDIEMPGGSGFDLIQKLQETPLNPTVIFVTAYNQFAIKAIKYSAFDYLLKPIDIDDLNDALDRYRKKVRETTSSSESFRSNAQKFLEHVGSMQKIKFSMRNGSLFVDPDEIVWCEASGSYTIIHFHNKKDEVVSVSMKEVEQILSNLSFFRVSRSAIINLRYLTRVDRRNKICIVQKDDVICKVKSSPQQLKLLESS